MYSLLGYHGDIVTLCAYNVTAFLKNNVLTTGNVRQIGYLRVIPYLISKYKEVVSLASPQLIKIPDVTAFVLTT